MDDPDLDCKGLYFEDTARRVCDFYRGIECQVVVVLMQLLGRVIHCRPTVISRYRPCRRLPAVLQRQHRSEIRRLYFYELRSCTVAQHSI